MPRSMNTSQARVVDPILSTHALGYRNSEFIGHLLFPIVNIPVRGARVLKFGKESFRTLNTRRAPGAETKRIEYGYASDPVALHQDALEGLVPYENMQEAARVPGIDLASGSVEMVLDVIALGREIEIANLARNTSSYGANNKEALSGTDKWTDANSNPARDIEDAKEQVRRRIGRYPNTLTLGSAAFNALKQHPKIKEQFKYTSSDSITVKMLANYFNIETILVGNAVYLPSNAPDNADAVDVWGNDAILSYTPKGSNYRVPSFGYTYRLNGHPMVEKPYPERNRKSWIYPVTEDWAAVLTGADAGFLFKSPV